MGYFHQVDRPASAPGVELTPADVVRTFVFTANLAAQENSGDAASSVSVQRVLHRLRGSAESDSVLLALTDAPTAPTRGESALGYPLLPATDHTGGDGEQEPTEYLGFVHLNLPLLEDRHVMEFECVLDVGLLPVPGEELSDEARAVYGRLLSEAESVARRLGRSVLQLWLMHPAAEPPGTGTFARVLSEHGFTAELAEIQGVIELTEPAPPVLPEGMLCTVVEDYRVPPSLLAGVLGLLTAASTDIPHGGLQAERSVWTPDRLADAAARLRDRGAENQLVVLHDTTGVLALTEFSRHTGSDPEVVEQGVTIVAARARGRGLGRMVKETGLARLRDRWPRVRRVYTSNAVDNRGMRAVNAALGTRTISASSAWQKVPDQSGF